MNLLLRLMRFSCRLGLAVADEIETTFVPNTIPKTWRKEALR